MENRETVRTTLFDGGYGCDMEMSVPEAAEWVAGLLAQIPEEHRATSVFKVELEPGYYDDRDTLIFQVFYDRPETDAEMSERIAAERASKAAYAAKREAEERAAFAALKAKYEPTR